MDLSRLPEPLRRHIEERTALPAIEKVRAVLSTYVADADSLDEIRRDLNHAARTSTLYPKQYLAALETILTEPQAPGTLMRLVEDDANWDIDHDQTDNGAAVFLREIADMIRSAIAAVE